MQQRVLIIADLGHASPRIPGLARFLPQFGWLPVILTPAMSDEQKKMFLFEGGKELELIETSDFPMTYRESRNPRSIPQLARRVLKKLGVLQYIEFPDEHIRWQSTAYRHACEAIQRQAFGAILSSSSPVSTHLIANKLSIRYKIPWVADLRDLWTRNHNYSFSALRKKVEARLERRTLESAKALITVTPQLQRILEQDYGPKISWIPNGYFPRKKTHGRKHQSSRFTISYTGQIYDKRQDIGSFLDALNTLVLEQKADRSRLVFRYYGSSGSIVLRHRYKWPDLFSTNVEINDQVPLEESYRLQDGSDMLLLLNWNDPLEKGIATTKLNEYLSTGVPILATGGFGGDYVEYILKLTGAGYYCPTKEQIVLRLAKAYREYIEKGYVSMDREISNTRDFCYDHLAQKLAMVLSGLLFRHGFKEHR